jgi:hypothetical protein
MSVTTRRMTSVVSAANSRGFDRVVLEEDQGCVYAFAFERPAPSIPEWDYLLETWEEAKRFCLREWGVPLDGWEPTSEAPNSAS